MTFFGKIFNRNKNDLYLDKIIDTDRNFFISGRTVGEKYSEQEDVIRKLKRGHIFNIIITDKIEFVSDSFWKGFFNNIFKKYKTKESILKSFTFEIDDGEILNNLMVNLEILHLIHNP